MQQYILNLIYIGEMTTQLVKRKVRRKVEHMLNSDDFDREFGFHEAIRIVRSENAELLERLTDDV